MYLDIKNLSKISVIVFFLFSIQSCSTKLKIEKHTSLENVPIYTIKGFKDKRINAMYSLTYVSSNLDKKECHQENVISSSKKPVIGNRIYPILDENYTIKIPIELTDNTDMCGFKFREIELIMKRAGESGYDINTHIPILSFQQKVRFRSRTSGSEPIFFETDKKYFRVAPDTSFLCRTEWYERSEHALFYCIMQIDSGDTTLYPVYNPVLNPSGRGTKTAKNPGFGVDTITNSTLTINMIIDSEGSTFVGTNGTGIKQDYFREYVPPKKSFLKRLFD